MDKLECFHTKRIEKNEAIAIKSLYKGEATPEQQRLALSVIVNKLCRTHDIPYIPGSQDQSAFLAGRALVGSKILWIVKQSKPGQMENNDGG